MEDQEVDLVDAELSGALVAGVQRLVVAVVGDPDLGLEKDVGTVDAGSADSIAGLVGRRLEDAEAEGGQLDAVVQGEWGTARAVSRRARVTPQQAGLPHFGRRQVPGLRREEVASLAGVSVEYHKRLERGGAGGVSDSVLDAIADALQLDDAERAHLFDLARAAAPTPSRRRRRPPQRGVRPAIQQMLASILAPATVSNTRGTPSSANSTSPTKSWNSPPTAACASPSSKPSPAAPPNSGLGTAAREYADACEGATIGHGLAVRGERVRDAADDIDAWLRRVRLKAG